jgi:hypothetical protein
MPALVRRALYGVAVATAISARLSTSIAAQELPAWPDTFVARLEALALMQTLNADILASRSATLSLERWCRDHRLAEEPKILARVMNVAARAATAEQRVHLHVSDREPVKYRRVQLRCGDRVLSEAENWYVPGRLTTGMNRLLETTDTPFGKAIASLEPYRQTFAVKILWSPLPDGWADDSGKVPAATAGVLVMPDDIFEHRAILYTREHRPFAEVDEVYTRQVLAFLPRSRQ